MLSKAVLSVALASAIPSALGAVHEKLAAVPAGWQAAGAASSGTTMGMSVALTMQNLDQLESTLLSMSTPGNAGYGKHMDKDQIDSMFGPSQQAVSSVVAWLKSAGIANYNVDGAFIDFAADVGTANKLLNTTFQNFNQDGGSASKIRTLSYSVPDDIQQYVSLVWPTTYFGNTKAMVPRTIPKASRTVAVAEEPPTKRAVDASCQTSITPQCLKELYSVGDYTPDPKAGSRIGFGSFLNYSARYEDLALYEKQFGIPSQNFSVELIAGGINFQTRGEGESGEANLDVQNIVGVSHPLPVTEFITGGLPPFVPNIDQPTAADNQNEPYLPYYRYLLSKWNKDLPQVISNSYGDEEDSVPYNYAVLVCDLIGLMGLRGISILESSGDLGVGSGCLAPDNKTVEFNAIFPATCPYLTSVGGTQAVTPEIAWLGSSGGFSKYFKRPLYQEYAVGNYLAKYVSPATKQYYGQYTDFSGRGFPDVSAHSLLPDYWIYDQGAKGDSGGTSAASPTTAAIVALLNDARLRAGKPALGFLNPLIYLIGNTGLNDITGGYSIGCNGQDTQGGPPEPANSGKVPGARWNATEGWDPVTGYGTPNFQKLKALALKY